MPRSAEETTILKTLAYAQVFDYPLTAPEIYQRQIVSPKHRRLSLTKVCQLLQTSTVVEKKDGCYWLTKSNKNLFHLRRQRQHWAQNRQPEIYQLTAFLGKIPFVKAAYITGSLAMNNIVQPDDDIDVLIISASQRLWLTRLIIVPIVILLGKYRFHYAQRQTGWCFNLWLDEEALTLPSDRRTLYAAYEVIQAKQMIGTENILLQKNSWVGDFLPSFTKVFKKDHSAKPSRSAFFLLDIINLLAYKLQWLSMQRHHTIEKIGLTYAFFHPRNTQATVDKKYTAILQKYGILQ